MIHDSCQIRMYLFLAFKIELLLAASLFFNYCETIREYCRMEKIKFLGIRNYVRMTSLKGSSSTFCNTSQFYLFCLFLCRPRFFGGGRLFITRGSQTGTIRKGIKKIVTLPVSPTRDLFSSWRNEHLKIS